MKKNTEIIQQLYKHFATSDFAEVRKLFDENIVWEQMKGFLNGGIYKGSDEIIENVFSRFRQNWSAWKAVVLKFIEAEDFVFAEEYYEGVYKQTGKILKADFIHQYCLMNGRIVFFKQYTDTALIESASH